MASEAAGKRTCSDTSYKKQRNSAVSVVTTSKKTRRNRIVTSAVFTTTEERVEKEGLSCILWSTLSKMARISSSVGQFSPIFVVFLEPLFWEAHELALQARL
jgi:hypothetical protein